MPVSRRELILAGAVAPLLSSCTTDISGFSNTPLPELARRLGVCNAGWATLKAGKPETAATLSGCSQAQTAGTDAIFQQSMAHSVFIWLVEQIKKTETSGKHTGWSNMQISGYRLFAKNSAITKR